MASLAIPELQLALFSSSNRTKSGNTQPATKCSKGMAGLILHGGESDKDPSLYNRQKGWRDLSLLETKGLQCTIWRMSLVQVNYKYFFAGKRGQRRWQVWSLIKKIEPKIIINIIASWGIGFDSSWKQVGGKTRSMLWSKKSRAWSHWRRTDCNLLSDTMVWGVAGLIPSQNKLQMIPRSI